MPVLLLAAGCAQRPPAPLAQRAPDASIRMQVYAAPINSGGGALFYGGSNYRLIVAGLGVQGIEPQLIDVRGDVYGMPNPAAFPAAYAPAPAFSAPNGDLWLRNRNGVLVHLVPQSPGAALGVGGEMVAFALVNPDAPYAR